MKLKATKERKIRMVMNILEVYNQKKKKETNLHIILSEKMLHIHCIL